MKKPDKSPILLKLSTNVGFGERKIMAKSSSKYFLTFRLEGPLRKMALVYDIWLILISFSIFTTKKGHLELMKSTKSRSTIISLKANIF